MLAFSLIADGPDGEVYATDAGAAVLSELGIGRFDDAAKCSGGEAVIAGRRRRVRRFRLGSGGTIYLKEYERPGRGAFILRFLKTGRRASLARAEAENAAVLSAAGIETAEVLAFGEKLSAFGEVRSFLVTAAARGRALSEYLAQRDDSEKCASTDCSIVAALERLAKKLIDGGILAKDIAAKHLFFDLDAVGDAVGPVLIDCPRVDLHRPDDRFLVECLARLSVELPYHLVSSAARERALRRLLGERAEALRPAIDRAIRRLTEKRRFRRHWLNRRAKAEAIAWSVLADGMVVLDPRHAGTLEKKGWSVDSPESLATIGDHDAADGLRLIRGRPDEIRLICDAHDTLRDWVPTAPLVARWTGKKKNGIGWAIFRVPEGEKLVDHLRRAAADGRHRPVLAELAAVLAAVIRLGFRPKVPCLEQFVVADGRICVLSSGLSGLHPSVVRAETMRLRAMIEIELSRGGPISPEVVAAIRSIRFEVPSLLGRMIPVETLF